MKLKLILGLALVLGGGLFGCSTIVRHDSATVKTSWKDTKITLYRAASGAVQLDAKREVVTVVQGSNRDDWEVVAFVDPATENAWVGQTFTLEPIFYIETESNILSGVVSFESDASGMSQQNLETGEIIWNSSFVPNVKRGENVDAAIERFKKSDALKLLGGVSTDAGSLVIGNNKEQVENGLDPSLFQMEHRGSQFKETTIEAIDASDGKLRLDLKNPAGSHKASVWIDFKTWKVVKAIQDDNVVPVAPPHSEQYYREAAALGDAQAMEAMGDIFRDKAIGPINPVTGWPVVDTNSTDYLEAVKWYQKAAKAGDTNVENKLKELLNFKP
jgi:hypothetical protein